MRVFLLCTILLCSTNFVMAQCDTDAIFDNESDNAICFEVIDNIRYIYTNNIPPHDDNQNQGISIPDDPVAGDYSYTMCVYPEQSTEVTPLYEETETDAGCELTYEFGVSINGVQFNPNSAETFVKDDGSNNIEWHVEATSTTNTIGEGMGTDNGGHINSSGEYHYHNIPLDYFTNDLGIDGSNHSSIVGYAADGFPIYYKYVYADPEDALSAIEAATSGYTLKSGDRGGDGLTAPDGEYDGNYYEDYEYSDSNTILDECNGRFGVTPDFPYGTYYYVLTDEYPYVPRCFKGAVVDNSFRVGPDAACLIDRHATQDDCAAESTGCMDPFASNYDASANSDDGSCTYSSISWSGSWSNTDGPDANNDVVLTTDYTFSTDGKFSTDDLTVNSGVTLTVDSEEALVVNGSLTNNGTIVVASGGSLITYDGQSVGTVTIKRNTRYADGKYSFVGSPVAQSASITGSDLGSIVYYYDETVGFADQGLNRWLDASAAELVPGQGYAQAFQQEISFTGVPNDGTITFTGTFTDRTNSNPEGWNLVSNPYPAAISVSRFLAENDNIEGAVYFWDDNNSASARGDDADYLTVNGIATTENSEAGNGDRFNQHIGAMQGFFVKLTGATDTDITFTESMRVSDSNADDHYFRGEGSGVPFIRLNLTGGDDAIFEQTVIGWAADASDQQGNRLYDAPMLDGGSSNALYTVKSGQPLAIQGVSLAREEIALGLNIDQTGLYELDAVLEGYSGELYLKDRATGEIVDLLNEPYWFHGQPGTFNDRFLIITNVQNSITPAHLGTYTIADGKLMTLSEVKLQETVQVFNLSGQLMLTGQVVPEGISVAGLRPGVYVIHDGTVSQKVIIKQQ